MHNALLNNIATEIVANKVMDDKMKDYDEAQQRQLQEEEDLLKPKEDKEEDDEEDIFQIDETEEKMIQEMKERKMMEKGYIPKSKVEKNVNKYGEYREIEEGEFLDTLLKNKKVVCHFFHPEFEKCKVMDKHLRIIAHEHPETLFVKINAEKTPFFSVKLNIKVLPTVVFSNEGKAFDRIIGFEDLDGVEDFKTSTLSRKLVLSKMITPKNKIESGKIKVSKKTKFNSNISDSESDNEY